MRKVPYPLYCSANKQKLAGIGILQLKTKPVQGSGSCTFENRRLVCCRMNKIFKNYDGEQLIKEIREYLSENEL